MGVYLKSNMMAITKNISAINLRIFLLLLSFSGIDFPFSFEITPARALSLLKLGTNNARGGLTISVGFFNKVTDVVEIPISSMIR